MLMTLLRRTFGFKVAPWERYDSADPEVAFALAVQARVVAQGVREATLTAREERLERRYRPRADRFIRRLPRRLFRAYSKPEGSCHLVEYMRRRDVKDDERTPNVGSYPYYLTARLRSAGFEVIFDRCSDRWPWRRHWMRIYLPSENSFQVRRVLEAPALVEV